MSCRLAKNEWCERVGTPGLGSRLSTYWPTKWPNKWRCSHHTSADWTPTPCVFVASLWLKPKGRVWRADAPALSNQTGLAWTAKPITAATPGLGNSVCLVPTKHHHGSPLVMPAQPTLGECCLKYKVQKYSLLLKNWALGALPKQQQLAPQASHTWYKIQACVVNGGTKNLGQEPSWCRPKSR